MIIFKEILAPSGLFDDILTMYNLGEEFMSHNSYCQSCPSRMSCGALKQTLLTARQKIDESASGKELNAYYGALLYLQVKKWYYPHNISKCYFNNQTQIKSQAEKIKEVFLPEEQQQIRTNDRIRRRNRQYCLANS